MDKDAGNIGEGVKGAGGMAAEMERGQDFPQARSGLSHELVV